MSIWSFHRCEEMREYLRNRMHWTDTWGRERVRLTLHSMVPVFDHGAVTDWLWASMYSWAEEEDVEPNGISEDQRNAIFDETFNWCEATFGPSAYDPLEDADGELTFEADLHPDRKWAAHCGQFYFKTATEELVFKMKFG